MTECDDQDLRDRFQALRREDAAATTPFGATLAALATHRAARLRRRGPRIAAVLAALAAAGLVLVLALRDRGAGGTDFAAARWVGPTDFLLRLPGADLLRTVPELGRVEPSFTNVQTDRRTP